MPIRGGTCGSCDAVGPTLKEITAQLRAAEGERDQTQALALRKCMDLTDRARAAEEAKERAERERKDLEAQWVRESARLVRKTDAAEDRATAAEGALAGMRGERDAEREISHGWEKKCEAAEGVLREAREENGRIRKAYSALRDSYQGVLDFARDVHAIVSGKVQRTGMVRASPAVVARLIASDAVPTLDDVLARDKRAQPPPPETP